MNKPLTAANGGLKRTDGKVVTSQTNLKVPAEKIENIKDKPKSSTKETKEKETAIKAPTNFKNDKIKKDEKKD